MASWLAKDGGGVDIEMLLFGTAVVVVVMGKMSLIRGAGVFGLGVSMMRASIGVTCTFAGAAVVDVVLNGVGVAGCNGLRVPGASVENVPEVLLVDDGAKVPGAKVPWDATGANVTGDAAGAEVTRGTSPDGGGSGGGVVVASPSGGGVVVSV